jgi:hypothetical protein
MVGTVEMSVGWVYEKLRHFLFCRMAQWKWRFLTKLYMVTSFRKKDGTMEVLVLLTC